MKDNRASQKNNTVRESSYVAPPAVVSLDCVVAAPSSPDTASPSTTGKILPGSSVEMKTYWNDDAITSTYYSDDMGKGDEGNMNERLGENSDEVIPLNSKKTSLVGEAPLDKSYPGQSRTYENNPLLGVDKDSS